MVNQTDNNGWGEWSRYVLKELERLSDCVDKIDIKQDRFKEEIKDQISNMRTNIGIDLAKIQTELRMEARSEARSEARKSVDTLKPEFDKSSKIHSTISGIIATIVMGIILALQSFFTKGVP